MRFYRDIKKYFHYMLYAAKSQLRSEVSNSYLDWVWWILEPFCNMLIYTFIFGYVFHAKEPYFPAFIFIGISIWSFFSKTLNTSVKLIRNNKAIVTKVYIPKQILLLKLLLVNAFKMSLSFIIVILMMIVYRIKPSIYFFYVLPVIVVLLLITYGISCFLVHFGVYVEDLAYIVSILLSMTMYLTGIFYSIENRVPAPFGQLLNTLNPIAFLIHTMRNALLYNKGTSVVFLIFWFLISISIAIAGTCLIYKNENNYVKVV